MARLLGYFLLFLGFAPVALGSSGISYHGKILRPNGDPVNSSTTQFRIQILSPGSERCVLWEETQTKDLSQTAGVFSITINDATEPSLIANILPFTIERVFSNKTGFTGLTCVSGTTYTPSTQIDGRVLQAFFREATSGPWEQVPVLRRL